MKRRPRRTRRRRWYALRGGSWYNNLWFLRSVFRLVYGPTICHNLVGFRCAVTCEEAKE
jgi:formylglycine-generating enzyme required for sulfatase activity